MNRVLRLLLFTLTLLVTISAYAVEECDVALSEGKQEYNKGNYQVAKSLFDNVISWCGASYGDAVSWKQKCVEALQPSLSLSSTSANFSNSGGTKHITVTCSGSYSCSDVSNSAFSVSRSGNSITISCSANPYTSTRNGSFTVYNSDRSKSVRVSLSQSAATSEAYLNVSKTSLSASSSGNTEYITVDSNRSWEIEYPSASMYSATRDGNRVKVVIYSNSGSNSRSDYFNIKTTDAAKSVQVSLSQSGYNSSPYLTVSKESISATSSGKTEYITVSSNVSWEIQYPSGEMYTATKDGNQVKVVIKSNTSSQSRSDYFNIRTTDQSKSIKISLSQSAGSVKKAKIHSVWVDHNVWSGNQKGMRIHVKFDVEGMQYKSGNVSVYFHFDNSSSTALVDYNGLYKTTDGKVAVSETYTPSYANSTYSDFKIFMPISELHCGNTGTYNLKFNVLIWSDNKIELCRSSWTTFTLTY